MEQSSSIDSRANAEHLKIGRFLYRTSLKEKDLGTSEITISKLAGTFAAIRIACRIEKPEHNETYQVLTDAQGARILLKEEFPDGAIIELVRFNE